VLSIGRLAPGAEASAYYLERAGCPLDYYTGRGEAAGRWMGEGARALGLVGALTTPEHELQLKQLLAGRGLDGIELVKPVLRADPRSRVPTATVVIAVQRHAADRGLDVADLLRADGGAQSKGGRSNEDLLRVWRRSVADAEKAQRRPRWPTPTIAVDEAQRLLSSAGLDPVQVLAETTPTGRLRDRLAMALRHRENRVDVRVPGLDLTLSAPKSVSVLYALGPDDNSGTAPDVDGAHPDASSEPGSRVARLVQEAHRLAVAETLAYLELTCATALRGHHRGDGTDTRVETDGLIAAAFEHRSSRCGDPQLHTHVVVANLLHGRDNKWSALNTREIYTHARTAGFVYQAVLRGELTRTLGVAWGPVRNGQADIAGLPPELLRLFSKRRQQIEAQLERVGLDGPAAAQAATLATRPAKHQPDDGVRLQDRWKAEADAAGFARTVVDGALDRVRSDVVGRAGREAAAAVGPITAELADALLAPTGLTDKRASFDRRDLLRAVCELLPAGTPVRLRGLRALATRVLRDERVVPLLGDAPVGARRYSTRELLTLETNAVALARSLNGSGESTEPPARLAALAPAGLELARRHACESGLSAEQQQMVHRLLSSGAGVEVVVGAAGSGKKAALAVAARAWQQAGIAVQGTALAAIAARVLEDSAGIPSQSLQRLLNQTEGQPGADGSQRNDVLQRGGVLVVDEAGMVGTRTLHRLLTLAEHTGTKLVLVGDPRQLPEIDAGGLFATLAARLPAVTLTGNQRQQHGWEQRALRELRDGDVVQALSAYAQHERLRITDTPQELTATLLDDYEQHLRAHAPERILVIASSRGDARRLNAHLRERLLEHGRLGPDELRIGLGHDASRGYRTGEQVLVTANDYQLGLLNGTRGTVLELHPAERAVTVRLDDGRQLRLDHQYLRTGKLVHGYALTAHKAQGVTVDVALLWGTHALTRETGYVAMSRGRQANHLYSTWDLLRRDAGLNDAADLDRPSVGRSPDAAGRRALARAGLADRLASSGVQRTARSWWRRRPASTTPPPGEMPSRPAARQR
jgi:hypothetical protein